MEQFRHERLQATVDQFRHERLDERSPRPISGVGVPPETDFETVDENRPAAPGMELAVAAPTAPSPGGPGSGDLLKKAVLGVIGLFALQSFLGAFGSSYRLV